MTEQPLRQYLFSQIEAIAGQPLTVAYSGGVDSTVLLHLLVSLKQQGLIKSLTALHIHHGLSVNADRWADHCKGLCSQWDVPLKVVRVSIEDSSDIERQAREARYAVFEEYLPEGGYLLMGHHQDDQAETVLFRLLRGSGLDGVAGMSVSRKLGHGYLLRPLLNISRQAIEKYSKNNRLVYVEDDSNTDQRFRRNFIRHNLMPQIEAQWPGVATRLARFSEDVTEANDLLLKQTERQAQVIIQAPPSRLWGSRKIIDIEALEKLDDASARRVVRFWLANHGVNMPDRVRLQSVFGDLINASEGADPIVDIESFQLRRFSGKLVLVPKSAESEPADEVIWNWQEQSRLPLPCSGGVLSVEPCGGVSLPAAGVKVLSRSQLPSGLKVAAKGRRGRKTIKRWLQDYQVPPWVREIIPFVFYEDELVALPGVFVTEKYGCEAKQGYQLIWKP
ncbi:tRNA lysidine(34) synthetase TilS [Endozoicomonas arenosclerae]|uniref:tRNA lysidine(34) synthetase TilS n=1 Tax=Endozoicomonas arenosclerae TaxID=1633495 RepID=UPI0007859165|nr:tRNA lysidine(34) synthetase TilS [Endozoicomonas arenosclerae]